jgi:hypothetical protein
VEAVESSESLLLRQISSSFTDSRCGLKDEVVRPVLVQIALDEEMFFLCQGTLTAEPCDSAPCLGVGNHRGADKRGLADEILDLGRTVFFDVELDETAGVEIEDQRRSSRTISDALFPRLRGLCLAPTGFPPAQSASPDSTSSQARLADSPREINIATERPPWVMTIRSPA